MWLEMNIDQMWSGVGWCDVHCAACVACGRAHLDSSSSRPPFISPVVEGKPWACILPPPPFLHHWFRQQDADAKKLILASLTRCDEKVFPKGDRQAISGGEGESWGEAGGGGGGGKQWRGSEEVEARQEHAGCLQGGFDSLVREDDGDDWLAGGEGGGGEQEWEAAAEEESLWEKALLPRAAVCKHGGLSYCLSKCQISQTYLCQVID